MLREQGHSPEAVFVEFESVEDVCGPFPLSFAYLCLFLGCELCYGGEVETEPGFALSVTERDFVD